MVNILLSTYNGEKYIKEQLDSLIMQTYKNIRVYIRDDGSTDRTVQIIQEFMRQHPKLSIKLLDSSGINTGFKRSFWTLLSECDEAEYYAFCDQDDVWLPDKVLDGVTALQEEDSSVPLLYTSGYDYYTEDLQFCGHGQKAHTPVLFKDVIFYTPAFGFTILLNHSLRTMALRASCLSMVSHDDWCLKIAAGTGKIIYNPVPSAKYRRHLSTATVSETSRIKMIRHWLNDDILNHGFRANYISMSKFIEEYGAILNPDLMKTAMLFSDQPTTAAVRIKRLFYPHRLRPSLGGELALRICFLLNS